MNKTQHKWAEVICAWVSGKNVQFKRTDNELCGWVDFDFNAGMFFFDKTNLEWRIKPVKRYRVAAISDNTLEFPYVAGDEWHAQFVEQMPNFVKWLTDWVEYE